MNSYIKNRNRLVNLFDNCSKIIRNRNEYDKNQNQLALKLSNLSLKLREEEHCEDTVSWLYSRFETILDIQKRLKDKSLSTATIELLDKIVDEGEKVYKKEMSARDSVRNSKEYLVLQKENTEKEISTLESDLSVLKGKDKVDNRDILQMTARLSALKSALEILNKKIAQKENAEDEAKELKKKLNPMSSNIGEMLQDLQSEKKRLVVMFNVYIALIVVVVAVLIFWETTLINNLYADFPPKNWAKCIILYLPIPLSAGLLWAFIYQMNRAQRQLVRFAERIHQIKYKDSLLQTSMELYSDGRKNEEHVAQLIDNIMMHEPSDDEAKSLTEEEKEKSPLSIPFENIIELIKAFGYK